MIEYEKENHNVTKKRARKPRQRMIKPSEKCTLAALNTFRRIAVFLKKSEDFTRAVERISVPKEFWIRSGTGKQKAANRPFVTDPSQKWKKPVDPEMNGFPETQPLLQVALFTNRFSNDASQEVSMKSILVAIYARVSTREKQETLNQLFQLREFCRRQRWKLLTEYIDHETGSVSTRVEFQKMLLHASQRKFDVLLFWALDRLTREGTLATLQYLERLTSYEVGYKSFTEPYLDSCGTFKDVVISLLATMAKQERLRLGERVRAGLERVRRQGKKLGRPPLRRLTGQEVAKLRRERDRTKAPFRILASKWGLSVWSVHKLCGGKRP